MKQVFVLLVAGLSLASCHSHPDVDFSITDEPRFFYMNADFDHAKTRLVERYMDREIGRANNLSFINTNTNAVITLDDQTKFHLRKEPGHVRIRINKDENSRAAYFRIRSMCEGMKEVIIQ